MAVYWRVEEEVDRPVAGSTFMLGVIITAAGERGVVHYLKKIKNYSSTSALFPTSYLLLWFSQLITLLATGLSKMTSEAMIEAIISSKYVVS